MPLRFACGQALILRAGVCAGLGRVEHAGTLYDGVVRAGAHQHACKPQQLREEHKGEGDNCTANYQSCDIISYNNMPVEYNDIMM